MLLRGQAVILAEVRSDLRAVKAYVTPTHAEAVGLDVFRTVTTKQELYDLEDSLRDKAVVKDVTSRLIYDLGTNIQKSVQSVMYRLAKKEVWAHFSHKGQRGAEAFVDLYRLTRLVTSFIAKHRKTADGSDVNIAIDRALQVFFSENKRRSRNGATQGKVGNELVN